MTEEKAHLLIAPYNYTLIDITQHHIPKLIITDCDKYIYYVDIRSLGNPKKFSKANPFSLYNLQNWITINNKSFTLIEGQSYKGTSQKYLFKCDAMGCKEEFDMLLFDIVNSKCACPYCSNHRIGKNNNLTATDPDIAAEWDYVKNGNLLPTMVTRGSDKKAWWVCSEGHSYYTKIRYRTCDHTGCPECSKSKAELAATKYFKEHDIEFIYNHYFEGLYGLGGGLLTYDYFFPETNNLLELQGHFHDPNQTVSYIKERYPKQKVHDDRKKEWANMHNLKLAEIWYPDFPRINEVLDNYNSHGFFQ